MKDYIFLLGRPGCGKSFVYETITRTLIDSGKIKKVKRLDDFPILKELLDADTEFKRHVRKEGGFEVTDWTIVDDVLKTINDRLPEIRKDNDLVFVEFARDKYIRALGNFSGEVLEKALILYIYCPFDVCLARNRRRFELQKSNALDDHIVPSDLMETYYRNDDIEKIYLENPAGLGKILPCDYIVVDNSKESLTNLIGQFEAVLEKIQE
ncbi:MAG: hypothetical protein J7L54_03475 [Elusimicrobia bacterium]|nr:hypothetical protein [Elusimicrobiota bacterium]